MKKEIKDLMPEWTSKLKTIDRNLTLTNDMDSLLSTSLLHHLFGLKVNYYYSFSRIARLDQSDIRKSIGIDCALKTGYCFDNHMTKLNATSYVNEQSANINVLSGINRDRYTDKFAMSTLIQLWSLYDVPLPTTIEGKMILLCIDVGFKGFYSDAFKKTFLNYLEQLEMMELVEVLESHTKQEMYDFMIENELDTSILLGQNGKRKGQLFFQTSGHNKFYFKGFNLDWIAEHLGLPIDFPDGHFEVVQKFKTQTLEWHELNSAVMKQAFSYAFINKNKIMISLWEG